MQSINPILISNNNIYSGISYKTKTNNMPETHHKSNKQLKYLNNSTSSPINFGAFHNIQISEVKNLTTKRIPFRDSSLKQFEKVYTDYHDSLNEVSIEDIKKAVNNIEKTTDYPREKILSTMQQATQFANIRSLNTVIETLKNNDIMEVGKINQTNPLTKKMFGLNSSLNYLIVQKFMEVMRGEKIAVFLDKNKLDEISSSQACKDAIKNNENDIKFFVLSGFNNGINFLNRTKDLEQTTRELLKHDNIDADVINQAKKLGIKPIIIKNEQEPNIENIYMQMRPEQMSKEELNAVIDASLFDRLQDPQQRCDVKSDIIQHLDNALIVLTPESMAKGLKNIHQHITEINTSLRKNDNDITYIIPTSEKSYSLINHQYQLINNIETNKFVNLLNIRKKLSEPEMKNKTFVILDDSALSGESLSEKLATFYNLSLSKLEKQNNNIIIAPIFSTQEGAKHIENYITRNNRNGKDILIFDKKQSRVWDQDIQNEIGLNLAIGDSFYDFYNPRPPKPCVVFPYMAPDNDSEFAGNIALLHNIFYRLNGTTKDYRLEGIKSYTADSAYIADVAKELLSNSK